MSVAARFQIEFHRFLDRSGAVVSPLPDWARDPSTLLPLYRAMTRTRAFDQRCIALQRSGQIGTYASSLGQEAVGVGVASAMRAEDVLLPSFREHGAQLWRGVAMVEALQSWGGDERGNRVAGPSQDFPPSIPVASHTHHAAGVALAFKLRGEKRVAVCIFGDGATSKGDFYEAINVAGAWKLPAVFIVNNNQWAISVPRAHQTGAETLAQKALAAGIFGEQVDGNDAIAVRDRAEHALARARAGGGATLIEAITYRLADHTTADDASRYRAPEVLQAEWQNEPLSRLRRYLVDKGAWNKDEEQRLQDECTREIAAAAAAYQNLKKQPPESIFDFQFATLPPDLEIQRAALLRELSGDG